MPARALIINADDLGLHPAVDGGILQAWARRAISGSTVFATASTLPAILAEARQVGLPTGIHLNLTMGRPLSDPGEIPALVTADDAFMTRRQWARPLPADQVRRELQRQLCRVLDAGLQPTHLDSHHHVHNYPEVLAIVIELAHAHSLPVRATGESMRETLRKQGICTPDHFTMAFYDEAATVETLIAETERPAGGVLEIMTHPGLAAPDIPSSYRDARSRELTALTDPRWHAYLRERGIPLIGYGAV